MASLAPRIPADTFAARLLLVRHELGLSVDEISAQCGIASATWSTWERGTRPRDKEMVVRAIAEATGYDAAWLMFGAQFPLRREWVDVPSPSAGIQERLLLVAV